MRCHFNQMNNDINIDKIRKQFKTGDRAIDSKLREFGEAIKQAMNPKTCDEDCPFCKDEKENS